MTELSHFDKDGKAQMVDVGGKPISCRSAMASARIQMEPETLLRIRDSRIQKGDVLAVARIAGITASKKTADLIPLCHTLPLDSASIEFQFPDESHLLILATVQSTGRTGVEMEALTSATVTALTVYDMCKSVDRAMVIENVQLDKKSGGKSGDFVRDPHTPNPTGS